MVHSQEVGPTITAALDDGPLQGRRIETHAVEGRPPSTGSAAGCPLTDRTRPARAMTRAGRFGTDR
jgi:hypothetical protein